MFWTVIVNQKTLLLMWQNQATMKGLINKTIMTREESSQLRRRRDQKESLSSKTTSSRTLSVTGARDNGGSQIWKKKCKRREEKTKTDIGKIFFFLLIQKPRIETTVDCLEKSSTSLQNQNHPRKTSLQIYNLQRRRERPTKEQQQNLRLRQWPQQAEADQPHLYLSCRVHTNSMRRRTNMYHWIQFEDKMMALTGFLSSTLDLLGIRFPSQRQLRWIRLFRWWSSIPEILQPDQATENICLIIEERWGGMAG